MSENQNEVDKPGEKKPGFTERIKTIYREQPAHFAFGLMGLSIVALVLGTYLQQL